VTSALAPGYSGKSLGWIDGSRVAARDKRLIGIRTGAEVTDPYAIGRPAGQKRRVIGHREPVTP
jgi:hypothetical protein